VEWARPIMNIVSEEISDIVDHAVSVAFADRKQRMYVYQ